MHDDIDRRICALLQSNARASATEIAAEVGLSVSATNERLRRLSADGSVLGWHARLDPDRFDAALCAFLLIDMRYEGEVEAVAALTACDEVQELHHISGPHSYLAKLRLKNTAALQSFLTKIVKPLPAIQRTETILSLDAAKETAKVKLPDV